MYIYIYIIFNKTSPCALRPSARPVFINEKQTMTARGGGVIRDGRGLIDAPLRVAFVVTVVVRVLQHAAAVARSGHAAAEERRVIRLIAAGCGVILFSARSPGGRTYMCVCVCV